MPVTGYQGPAAPAPVLNTPVVQPALPQGYNGEQLSGRGSFSPDMPQGYNGESLSGLGSFAGTPGAAWAGPSTTPPPVDAPPDFTASMGAYANQFKQSQANMQQAINAGLLQAMQGLGQRRDAAAGLVNALPGQYNTIMKNSQDAAKLSSSLAQGSAPRQDTNGALAATNQLIASGNQAIGNAGHAMQPLLNAGVLADYSKGATALNNTHMQNEAGLNAQQSDFDQKMAFAKAGAAQDWAKMEAGFQHDRDMGKLSQGTSSVAGQEQLLQWQQDHGMLPKNNSSAVADATARQYHFNDDAALQQQYNDPYYQAVEQAYLGKTKVPVGGDAAHTMNGSNQANLLKQVAKTNVNVLYALAARGRINPADIATAIAG